MAKNKKDVKKRIVFSRSEKATAARKKNGDFWGRTMASLFNQFQNLFKKEERNERQRICEKSNFKGRVKKVNINRASKRSAKNR
jgi:ribosomal protein S30